MSTMSRRTLLALVVIGHLLVMALPAIAPYAPEDQHRMYPLAPPTPLHLSVSDGVYVCSIVPLDRFSEYREDCSSRYPVGASGIEAPGVMFLMGTDELGRDVASQFLAGARHSLFAAEAATLLSLLIAGVAGIAGGYVGGLLDRLILRAGDVVLALPWLYAILALRGALPLSVRADVAMLLMIGLLALVGWVRPARVFRALVAGARTQGYVQAAAGFGAPASAIVIRHLLPLVKGAALTQAALLIPQFMLAEVALSVLGVVGDSSTGWGPLVAALQRYAVVSAAWWLALPALIIVGLFIVLHKFADALQHSLRVVPQRG